jgi:hypothetical protein
MADADGLAVAGRAEKLANKMNLTFTTGQHIKYSSI